MLSYYRLIMPFLNSNINLEFNREKLFDPNLFKSFQTVEIHHASGKRVTFPKDIENHVNSSDWMNLLIQGDNKYVMQSLLEGFKGKIDLIYIDPPFFTGGDFHFKTFIGEKDSYVSNAYSDSWDGGLESYIHFIYKRLILLKELLSKSGSIYLHLDWHVSHYIKILLDQVFGEENFRNEIIWAYPAASVKTRKFYIRSYDTIFFYTKSDTYIFRDDPHIYMEYSDRVKSALKKDEKGLFYYRGGSHNGKKLSRKVYVESDGIFPRDVWTDIPYIRANTKEYQGFSTQKPERLLKRIILASTNENGLIADFFCGTGTALIAAEKLGRRWIGCDITPQSIHICRKRMLDVKNSNDLFNWSKKYKKEFNSFKLLKIHNIENDFQIPGEYLNPNASSIPKLITYKKPDFDVSIKTKEYTIQITLSNYKIPYTQYLDPNIIQKINHFSDWIDYWSIDFNFQGDYMNCDWTAYRNPKNRELHLSSKNFNFKQTGTYKIRIKVVNIIGHESEKDYVIEI